jgi:hypothetical protein
VLREERLLGEIAGPFAHGNHAILASLAAQDQKLMAFEAKVADGEVHKLSPSDPRGVQKLQDRPVAQPQGRGGGTRLDDLHHLFRRESMRQTHGALAVRLLRIGYWVHEELLEHQQPLKEVMKGEWSMNAAQIILVMLPRWRKTMIIGLSAFATLERQQ